MSYALYIGRNLTADGTAYLAGYGDEPSSHWLELVARATHAPGATIRVGVTPEADLPGILSDIPQAAQTARHLRVSYSYYKGVPAPLTNGGLNEHGVAVRDVWSPSRPELVDMTPRDQTGPNYSDLARIVLERARNAREGVALIGDLIAAHGYSDYGGNSHLIADPDEAWVVIEFAGGQKLWAAERLGPDSIRASRPGYIGEIPARGERRDDFLFPPHFLDFAAARGWHEPGTPFDVNRVYGDGKGPWAGMRWIEDEMRARSRSPGRIGLRDVIWAVRTPRLTGDTAGYGQIVPLRHPSHAELRLMWHAPVGPVAAPFVPVFLGIDAIPPEYRQHRYLTDGEASRFLDMRHAAGGRYETVSQVPQAVESTRSAFAVFKRLQHLVIAHHELFHPEVVPVFEALEGRSIDQAATIARLAELAFGAEEREAAVALLSYFVRTEMAAALELGERLVQSLDARSQLLFGVAGEGWPRSMDQLW